eukprot:scaffold118_cov185-Amphora_coffeaeformis.AAC.12
MGATTLFELSLGMDFPSNRVICSNNIRTIRCQSECTYYYFGGTASACRLLPCRLVNAIPVSREVYFYVLVIQEG